MVKVAGVELPRVPYLKTITQHYSDFWGAIPKAYELRAGPFHELSPGFCVLEFAPTTTRSEWTYASCGMSNQPDAPSLEIHLFAPYRADEHIELLTMAAHYHLTGDYLGLGHTVNIGRPWLPGSKCEHALISLPYLDGPNLEWLTKDTDSIRFLWLIPITLAERDFKKTHGLEALEKVFEEKGINYAEPFRSSLV